jgi:hypothetical protein
VRRSRKWFARTLKVSLMSDQPNKGFFAYFFGGSTPQKTSGDEFYEDLGNKIELNTPQEPYKQGFLNSFIKRWQAGQRLYQGDYPEIQSIKKGIEFTEEVVEYVQTDGPSHVKEDGLQVVKQKAIDKLTNAEFPDLIEGVKTVHKATSIATATTPEMVETMTNDSMTMIKETGKQTATTIGGGIAVGMLIKQGAKLPMPLPLKLLMVTGGVVWTGSGFLATSYSLSDLGKKTEDQHVTIFKEVMKEHSKRVGNDETE